MRMRPFVLMIVVASVAVPAPARAGTAEQKVTGPIKTVAPTRITVSDNGQRIEINLASDTAVERLGARVPATSLHVGDRVKVKFTVDRTGGRTAVSVKVGVPTSFGLLYSTDVEAKVLSARPGVLSVSDGKKLAGDVRLDSTTIYRRFGQKIGVADVKQGDTVKLHLRVAGDASAHVVSLDVGVDSSAGVLFSPKAKGVAVSVAPGSLVVQTSKGDKLTFRLSARTAFERNGIGTSRNAVRVGSAVKLTFTVGADRMLEAQTVQLGIRHGDKLVFAKGKKGSLLRLARTRLVLRSTKGTRTFAVTAHTVFVSGSRRLTWRDLRRGAAVKVVYLPGSPDVALRVVASRRH